ncbi:hypothetical protein DLM45_00415 [Hyphomicrobium methylovorum]|uniref:DUF5330 domain-containing protein n=1 Tax=Hyphomicrobium methylovorum TaxID=84 RepID=UPI0015E6AB48|nr:DUF5330 domain-containing protein [Hyphomicrobium methylovorum]MBA2124693.1 hypothetical protein [Hyphomicrobium methylovorum]
MGLLRIATIAAVAIALLPSDREQQQRLYERAGDSANWVLTFCDRNGPTCEKGAELWAGFLAKAEFGVKLAYDMARERGTEAIAAADSPYKPAVLERESGSTLTPVDKEPAWRGKKPNKGSI